MQQSLVVLLLLTSQKGIQLGLGARLGLIIILSAGMRERELMISETDAK
jgi:hypothetical protein